MIKDNFVKMLEDSIKNNWDLPALSDYKGKTYLYKDVARKIARIHIMFEECNIQPGDKIALCGKNSANWAMVYLATVTYGAVIVPILADFKTDDIHHIVKHSDSKVLFVGDPIWENLDESNMSELRAIFSLTDFRLIIQEAHEKIQQIYTKLDGLYEAKYKGALAPELINYPEVTNDKVAILNYTSGTSGFSKGVVLPANSLAVNVKFFSENLPLKPGDNVVSILPLAHTYGCAFEFLSPFKVGCHINFLTRTPSPKIIINAFKEIKPRVVLAVPLILEKIYKNQILPILNKRSMKVLMNVPLLNNKIFQQIRNKLVDSFGGNFVEVIIGGAALNAEVEDFLKKIQFPFTVGYGMTECGPLIAYASHEDHRKYSCGKLMDEYLEIKIDSDDPHNTPGEIILKGEQVMYGYYKNEEATKESMDSNGWLHTGDMGVIDEDKFVYIRGRSKNMLLASNGQNVYPEEIEAKINNMPFVQESLVIQRNDQFVALVYPDYSAADESGMTKDDLDLIMEENRKNLNEQLPAYESVKEFQLFPSEFEKTAKRSIKRFLYTR